MEHVVTAHWPQVVSLPHSPSPAEAPPGRSHPGGVEEQAGKGFTRGKARHSLHRLALHIPWNTNVYRNPDSSSWDSCTHKQAENTHTSSCMHTHSHTHIHKINLAHTIASKHSTSQWVVNYLVIPAIIVPLTECSFRRPSSGPPQQRWARDNSG